MWLNKSLKIFCPILLSFVFSFLLVQVWTWTDGDQPLLLTPFLEAGDISRARKASLVKWRRNSSTPELAKDAVIPSYSGFLTVDKGCASKIFFWFFPATVGKRTIVENAGYLAIYWYYTNLVWCCHCSRNPVAWWRSGWFWVICPFLTTRSICPGWEWDSDPKDPTLDPDSFRDLCG